MGKGFPSRDVHRLFVEAVRIHSEKKFLVLSERSVSYRQMSTRVDKLAREMARFGVGRGARVGTLLASGPEFIEICLASLKLGATFVPIDARLGIVELETILKSSALNLLFYSPGVGGINTVMLIEEMQFQLRTVEKVFAVLRGTLISKQPFDLYEDLYSKADVEMPDRQISVREDDVALMFFAAEGSGRAVASKLTHREVLEAASGDGSAFRVRASDRILPVAPLFTFFGFVNGLAAVIAGGATLCIPENFRSETVLHALEREAITVLEGAPADFAMELESPLLSRVDLSSLRLGVVGGSPCPRKLAARIKRALRCRIAFSAPAAETGLRSTG